MRFEISTVGGSRVHPIGIHPIEGESVSSLSTKLVLDLTLVVLRSLASDAGHDTDEAFDAAADWSSERIRDVLLNARNHPDSAIRSTIRSFGPPTDTGS